MSEHGYNSNVDKLHDLATQLVPEELVARGVRVEEDQRDIDIYANFHNGLEVIRKGNVTVVSGLLGLTKSAQEQPFTVSFDGVSTEPTTFMDWNRIRQDSYEGSTVPKAHREKVAARLIELFAA